jgi:hypothetical protein
MGRGLLLQPITVNNTNTHSAWLLWTGDWPITETPNLTTHNVNERQNRTPGGIRTHNPSTRASTGMALVPTWSDNKVRELIAVKVLHTSLLKTTVIAFKVLPLGSHATASTRWRVRERYCPTAYTIPKFMTVLHENCYWILLHSSLLHFALYFSIPLLYLRSALYHCTSEFVPFALGLLYNWSKVRFSPYRPWCRVCTGSRSVSRSYHGRFLPNPFQIEIRPSVLITRILRKWQGRN